MREEVAIRGPLMRSFTKGHADRMKESRLKGTIFMKIRILSRSELLDLDLVVEPYRVVVKKIGDERSIVAGQNARFPA